MFLKLKYCNKKPNERYIVSPGDIVISHTDMTEKKDLLEDWREIREVLKKALILKEALKILHYYAAEKDVWWRRIDQVFQFFGDLVLM